jgi:hypothetical protein
MVRIDKTARSHRIAGHFKIFFRNIRHLHCKHPVIWRWKGRAFFENGNGFDPFD